MKGFLVIGVLCGVALASDYQYVEVVPSHSTPSYDGLNVYIASYKDKYSTTTHRPHHSAGYGPRYKPQRTAYRYVGEPQPQYYLQPQYYPQRRSRGYSTNVPVYGELKPVSAPIIHRPKPFHLPQPKIVETSHKPAYSYGGHQRTGYSTLPQYYPYPHPTPVNYPTPVYPLSPPVHTSSQRLKRREPVPVEDAQERVLVEDAQEPVPVEDAQDPVLVSDAQEPVHVADAQEPVHVADAQEPVPVADVQNLDRSGKQYPNYACCDYYNCDYFYYC